MTTKCVDVCIGLADHVMASLRVRKAHFNCGVDAGKAGFVQHAPDAGGGVARLRRWVYVMEKLTSKGFVGGGGRPPCSASSVEHAICE